MNIHILENFSTFIHYVDALQINFFMTTHLLPKKIKKRRILLPTIIIHEHQKTRILTANFSRTLSWNFSSRGGVSNSMNGPAILVSSLTHAENMILSNETRLAALSQLGDGDDDDDGDFRALRRRIKDYPPILTFWENSERGRSEIYPAVLKNWTRENSFSRQVCRL